ncbi:hypothetical protein IX38_22680 [Chryseobacterium luteum]|uniref:Uncharacterized protein n=1 Tax=Chryseobacterium luteum TaxID=421531 RepID=A0A085YXJ3_9FLAO|nr:hypothetical protein IX38_22680 [Chryseobacterium luteum]
MNSKATQKRISTQVGLQIYYKFTFPLFFSVLTDVKLLRIIKFLIQIFDERAKNVVEFKKELVVTFFCSFRGKMW